jgi:hypothetical protein
MLVRLRKVILEVYFDSISCEDGDLHHWTEDVFQ